MNKFFITATASLALTALFVNARSIPRPASWQTSHFENVLGTSMEVKVMANSEPSADQAEAAALAEIKRLNAVLSGYDPSSEFSRWARTQQQPEHLSPELIEVLKLWDAWRVRTGGALNPAAEAVIRVWKNAEKTGQLPTEAELSNAAHQAQATQWRVDEKFGTATRLTNTPLVLNSFTKSYIVERAAAAAMRVPGVNAVVLNIGGDLVVRGIGSDKVSVTDPKSDAENSDPIAILNVTDRAVATSGNYRRGFEIGGEHYSHIVDPRTGQTAEAIIGATVITPKAVDAGALATAFCVLLPEESRKLAASIPGTEYMLVSRNGDHYYSAGWNALQTSQPHLVKASYTPAKAAPAVDTGMWNPAYELTIGVEIPQTQGFGARRPYVAVWIEDKDHYPVRTINVLFDKVRYLNELRAWYRDDRLRAMSEGNDILNSVTSATRSPGKYTFKWDGKDNSGKPVKEGHYTVLIEAAREHGGYTLDRREIDFNGTPLQAQLQADGELGAVALDYHKVAH